MITAIILTLNSERFIYKCLCSLLKYYPYPISQIIVVDGGSKDNTLKIAQKFPVTIVKQKRKGISAARNEGLIRAKNKYIFFLDVDAFVKKIDFNKVVKCLGKNDIGVVSLATKTPITNKIAKYIDNIRKYNHEEIRRRRTVTWFAGCSFIMKKGIGYFDTKHLYGADDICFAYRIVKKGYKIVWLFDQDIYHYARDTILEYIREQYGWGRGSKLLFLEYEEYRRLSNMLKAVFRRILAPILAIRILIKYGIGTYFTYIVGRYAWLVGFIKGWPSAF